MSNAVVECPMDTFQELLEELLARGERATFRVAGISMRPTIRSGDRITVERVEPGSVRVGDILVFRVGASICVHRVIRIGEESGERVVRSAGDGNLHDDGTWRASDVVGRVVRVSGTRGEWSPDSRARRLHALARVLLARHGRLRAVLRRVKHLLTLGRRGEVPA